MTAVRSLCSRALWLSAGRLVFSGEPSITIGKYLGHNVKHYYECEWSDPLEAPQNGSIRINKISLCDSTHSTIREIYTDTELHISICFEINNEEASAGLTVLFFDYENRLIFSTINNHEPNWYGKCMPFGSYRSICKIPANLLNNGNYSIGLIFFGKNFTDAVTVSDVMKLEVLDSPAIRGDFFGDFGGAIRPLLEWSTWHL
jgi:lipopolysaccharide transport system ATP-binding protein